MTDGSLTFDENAVEYKTFNAKDGQGIVMLNRHGLKTAIITARDNGTVECRAKMLGITKLFMGQKNKEVALNNLCNDFDVSFDEIAYMGDDLPYLCELNKVGLPSCPNDAVDDVKEAAIFISSKNGGRGAVRELCDFILKSREEA